MTSEELMCLAPTKAICEMSWDSIKFLFRPSNGVELLLRLDFDGMRRKISDWIADDSPDVPRRLPLDVSRLLEAVRREEFYREMNLARRAARSARDTDGRRDDIFKEIFSINT